MISLTPILVSLPVAVQAGLLAVAALASVTPLTAEPVAVRVTRALPLVSSILVPILGEVKVLLVRVWVAAIPARVSAPEGMVTVPEFEIDVMMGVVKVLLVRV